MKIRTDSPFLQDQEKITATIANYWDQMSEGWHEIWGPHIHHGFYEDNDGLTPLKAQEKLMEKLAEMLEITPHSNILDVGCGMGGSSLFLAKKYQARIHGITLSPKQVIMATKKSEIDHLPNATFKVEDALSLASFNDASFDIVWSLESCEQFYNKKRFIDQAFRVLKPGGQLILATWCSDSEEYEGKLAEKYQKLCVAFDLPYMPTFEYYSSELNRRGFRVKSIMDWSNKVKKSWDVGMARANAYSILKILKMSGWRGLTFVRQLKLMRDAFEEGSVKYGVFLASKP